MRRAQAGLAAVEFAIVGVYALAVLIGAMEVGRMLFVWNTLGEATRRGARVATVNASAATVKAAVLTYAGHVPGLSTGNVAVGYLDEAGAASTVNAAGVAFVTVSITGYSHSLLIPGFSNSVPVPAFATTLPVESLGVDPDA